MNTLWLTLGTSNHSYKPMDTNMFEKREIVDGSTTTRFVFNKERDTMFIYQKDGSDLDCIMLTNKELTELSKFISKTKEKK